MGDSMSCEKRERRLYHSSYLAASRVPALAAVYSYQPSALSETAQRSATTEGSADGAAVFISRGSSDGVAIYVHLWRQVRCVAIYVSRTSSSGVVIYVGVAAAFVAHLYRPSLLPAE